MRTKEELTTIMLYLTETYLKTNKQVLEAFDQKDYDKAEELTYQCEYITKLTNEIFNEYYKVNVKEENDNG